MDQYEVSKQSQAAYEQWMAARIEAGDNCDGDLSPAERAERKQFDQDRQATYTGQWPARQK